MKINAAHDSPVFMQIADGMRARVVSGVYLAGEMVPSIRELAVQLRVNPNTVKRAYDELEREGVLEARKGVGMFVGESVMRAAKARAEEVVSEALLVGVRHGRAAGMDRKRVDACYAKAWEQVRGDGGKGGGL